MYIIFHLKYSKKKKHEWWLGMPTAAVMIFCSSADLCFFSQTPKEWAPCNRHEQIPVTAA